MSKCCCGHEYAMHIGGPELTLEDLLRLRNQPDGGMCRADVNGKRCECFNFCDCYEVTA
jgi:hypothetical protein